MGAGGYGVAGYEGEDDMSVVTSGTVIDQRLLSASERAQVAYAIREAWWDCYRHFEREVVDLGALGLSASSLRALADDLEFAGFDAHANAVRHAEAPTRSVLPDTVRRAPLPAWRPRVHTGAAAARC